MFKTAYFEETRRLYKIKIELGCIFFVRFHCKPKTNNIFVLGPTGYGCDFQSGFCTWTRDASAPFNWTRHRGSTASLETGPATDHTVKNGNFCVYRLSASLYQDFLHMLRSLYMIHMPMKCYIMAWYLQLSKTGRFTARWRVEFLQPALLLTFFVLLASGYYIYIETSSPRQQNDKARIISAAIPPDGRMGHCVKFWYHMYGPHVDALNVYKMIGSNMVLVWKRTGDNGNKWRYGQVDVNSNIQYKVYCYAISNMKYDIEY